MYIRLDYTRRFILRTTHATLSPKVVLKRWMSYLNCESQVPSHAIQQRKERKKEKRNVPSRDSNPGPSK